MLLVACTATSPMVLTHRAPKGSTTKRPVEGSYSFKVQFSTASINGATGHFTPYTAPDSTLQLNVDQAEGLVAYAKKTVKQPWAAAPVPHPLRDVWADLPAGTWLLP